MGFTPKDRFGVALSGGGIRSATFNLGLLQALEDFGVLKHVDYLSTVSGGGYIGGFWSAWRAKKMKGLLPKDWRRSPFVRDPFFTEEPEVRHLREFSRFLLPRVGVLETEFWGIVMTVIGGMIPSLLTAVSALSLVWSFWILLVALLSIAPMQAAVGFGLLMFALLVAFEAFWQSSGRSERNWVELFVYRGRAQSDRWPGVSPCSRLGKIWRREFLSSDQLQLLGCRWRDDIGFADRSCAGGRNHR